MTVHPQTTLVMETADDAVVAHLALNRPERANALGGQLVRSLGEALAEVDARGCDLLVLEGVGASFCAGLDLAEATTDSDEALPDRLVRIGALVEQLATLQCVTVALVGGWAVGAGADLVMACDYRLSTKDARLRFPGWRFGLALGTRRLVSRVGHSAALDLLLTGRTLDAPTAQALGLLTHVADTPAQLDQLGRLAAACPRVPAEARQRLLRLTRPAVDPADHQDLLDSVNHPDLPRRLRRYADSVGQGNQGPNPEGAIGAPGPREDGP